MDHDPKMDTRRRPGEAPAVCHPFKPMAGGAISAFGIFADTHGNACFRGGACRTAARDDILEQATPGRTVFPVFFEAQS